MKLSPIGAILLALSAFVCAQEKLTLVYSIGIRDGARNSDGVVFRSEIAEIGKPYALLASNISRTNAWTLVSTDITAYRGKKVSLRLSAGANANTADDWGAWGDVAIVSGSLPAGFSGNLADSALEIWAKFEELETFTVGMASPQGYQSPIPKESGGVFSGQVLACGGIKKPGFFTHPCWKGSYNLTPVVGDFTIDLSKPTLVPLDFKQLEEVYARGPFAALSNLALPAAQAAWTEDDKRKQRQAGVALLNTLHQDLSNGKKAITIPPGSYRFDAGMMTRLVFSNHGGAAIQAEGATFWLEGIGGIRFVDCRNIALRGLTIDFDPLPFTQGVIVSMSEKRSFFIIRIMEGFPLPLNYVSADTFMCLPFKPDGTMIPHQMESVNSVVRLEGRFFKVSAARLFQEAQKTAPISIGDVLVLPPRRSGAISLKGCSGMLVEKVTCYASAGFSMTETDGLGANIYREYRLIRRPDTKRFIAATADGFHSYRMAKGPRLEKCEISWACDDLVNIHGFFSMVLQQESPTVALIAFPFGLSCSNGSRLSFYRYDGMRREGSARVVSLEPITDAALVEDAVKKMPVERKVRSFPRGALYRAALDAPVETRRTSIVSDDGSSGNGFVIRDCYFHDNNVRGVLLKAADGLVEGNRFERIGSAAIAIVPEQYWLEGPMMHHGLFRSNSFLECVRQLDARSARSQYPATIAIQMSMHGGMLSPERLLSDILFEGNVIERSGGAAFFIGNAERVTLSGNRIRDSHYFPSLGNGKEHFGVEVSGDVFLHSSSRVRLVGNRNTGRPAAKPHVVIGTNMASGDFTTDD